MNERDIEGSVIATARELGIGIVAYAPLGRGFLSATFSNRNEISPTDFRSTRPRFTEENFDQNMAKEFFEYAKKKNCTPAQLALAWLHAQGDDIFPIPGTKTAARVEENLGALKIKLTATEAKEVGDAVPAAKGDRYEEASMTATFNYRM
jgi:aryl-alcohol dehydrogenase-like predicted oxidoreductase